MPRYEFKEGTSNKFWEIELEGNRYTARYGKVGSTGQSTTKDFPSAAAATKAYEKAIASKLGKGYQAVDAVDTAEASPSESPKAPALVLDPAAEENFIAALKQNPNDIDTYLAYAAWLQDQGNPRGNLIATQHKLLTDPQNKSLCKAEQDLLKQHSELFYGPFVAEEVDEMVDQVTWFMGFIKSARVKTTHDHCPTMTSGDGAVDIDAFLADVLDHPSMAFIQELSLGIMSIVDNSYDGACRVISERQIPTLQWLFVGDFIYEETELNWSEASTSGIYPSVPNLRSLTVRSGDLTFGEIYLPELREFETISGGMGNACIEQICNAYWPKLERLSLQFGPEGTSEANLLQDILDAKGIPHLTHLGITNANFTDAFVRLLVDSKILPQLDELDLKMGTFSDDGAKMIFDHKDAFGHLRFLNVDDCYLTDEGIALLRQVGPELYFDEQRDEEEPEDRYASMLE